MDNLDAFKTFLGPLAAAYTDRQLEQLCRDFDIAAELLLDIFVYTNSPHHSEDDLGIEVDTPDTRTIISESHTLPLKQLHKSDTNS